MIILSRLLSVGLSTGRERGTARFRTLGGFALPGFSPRARGLSNYYMNEELKERREGIFKMRKQGYTLQEIGERFGVTRQRVQQILSAVATEKPRPEKRTHMRSSGQTQMFSKPPFELRRRIRDIYCLDCGHYDCTNLDVSSALCQKCASRNLIEKSPNGEVAVTVV